MFRKADWFRPHVIGWGIRPITWQGWVWALVCASALIICELSILTGNWFWGSLMFAALFTYILYDVVRILAEIKASKNSEGKSEVKT